MVNDAVSEETPLAMCNQCGDRLPDGFAGHVCWVARKLTKVDGVYENQENLHPPVVSEFVASRPTLDDKGVTVTPR